MKRAVYVLTLAAAVWAAGAVAYAQPIPASQPATAPTTTQATPRPIAPSDLVVTVEGHEFFERDIDALLKARWPNMVEDTSDPKGRAMVNVMRDQAREELIDQWLLDREVAKSGVQVSDEDIAKFVDDEAVGNMSLNGLTREELDLRFRREKNTTLADFIAQRKADPVRRKTLLRNKLIRETFREETKVTDEAVAEFYERRLERRFKLPEQVRASHIFFGAGSLGAEQKAELRKKAETVLAEVRQPGADFAAAAAKYSDSATKEKGGDMGHFGREHPGLDKKIADAAFKLNVGEISDLVEVQDGWHILKVSERKEPTVVPLNQAKDGIRLLLEDQQIQRARRQYCTELRKSASIQYPADKPPRGAPVPTQIDPARVSDKPPPPPQNP
jgi:foldase protein PrsA